VQEGCAWARAQAGHGGLQPAAQGVASLLAIDGEDFTWAELLARAALAVHPGHPEALVAQASVDLARNRPDAAIAGLRTALAAAPHDGRTLGTMGFALLRAQDLAGAQQHLEAALLALPGHIGSWHALGWTRLLRGDRAGALAAFEAALQLDRNFAESHGGVGLLLALAGDAEGAERHLLLADKLDARNVTARFARAVQQGEIDEPQRLQALARRLLDQRGFFGGRLSDGVDGATAP
jgi:tetratricopeptide (TPR) repeat protein